LGKNVPEVSSTARGHRPRAVLETEGTVFPNSDRPRPVNNILFNSKFYFLRVEETIKKNLACEYSRLSFAPATTYETRLAKKNWKSHVFILHVVSSTYVSTNVQ